MTHRMLAATLVWVLGACGGATPGAGSAADDGPYSVRMRRELAVGTRWHEVTTYRDRTTQRMTLANQALPPRESDALSTLVADVDVLNAADGVPVVLRYRVTRCDRVEGAEVRTLVRPGAVMLTTQDAGDSHARVSIDGATIEGELADELHDLLKLRGGNARDGLFDTDRPRAVGERWYPDVGAMSEAMGTDHDSPMDPTRSSATMLLAGRDTRSGLLGTWVEGTFGTAGLRLASLPAEATLRESRLDVRFRVFVPDDAHVVLLQQTMELSVHAVVDIATERGPATLNLDSASLQTRTIEPR